MRPEWAKARALRDEAERLVLPVCGRCLTPMRYMLDWRDGLHDCAGEMKYARFCGRCDHRDDEHRANAQWWGRPGCVHFTYSDRTACRCPRLVGAQCEDCGEWSQGRLCGPCLKQRWEAACEEAERIWHASPEYQVEQERKEQRRWLREGQATLTAIRRVLANREA